MVKLVIHDIQQYFMPAQALAFILFDPDSIYKISAFSFERWWKF